MLPETGPSLIVLRCPFSHLYFAEKFGYRTQDCDFELRVRQHARQILAGRSNVELLDIFPSHFPSHYVETEGLWRELEGSQLLCVPTLPVFLFLSWYIIKHSDRQDLAWRTATSKIGMCSVISFTGLDYDGTNPSVSTNNCILRVEKGVFVAYIQFSYSS